MADTIFSALCHEAAKEDETGIGELVGWAEKGGLRISDVLPFIGETLYIPKPAVRIQVEQEGDSVIKKQFKKLKYIPIDRVEAYLQGKLDHRGEPAIEAAGIRGGSDTCSRPEQSSTGAFFPRHIPFQRRQRVIFSCGI